MGTHAYLVIAGATAAYQAPELIAGLRETGLQVITLMTPGAWRVISPRELMRVPGHRLVESYFDAIILPRPPEGLVLVAPCTFDSLNKLAAGIADSLALSVTSEAIGRGSPTVVAVSVNDPLWRHPRTATSVVTLRGWGVAVVPPEDHGEGLTLAPTGTIMAAVRASLESRRT